MYYVDVSGYKAINQTFTTLQTPFTGQHIAVRNALTGKFVVILYTDGVLELHPGFHHDWASGPTRDDRSNRYPAMGHDALFLLLRKGAKHFTWQGADQWLIDACRAAGMSRWRGWMWWLGRRVPFAARRKQAMPRPLEPYEEVLCTPRPAGVL